MSADPSSYAALGVDPGSDDAEIEQAYRRLIKRYHPDRLDGDPERAAEVNRAYRELRTLRDLPAPLDLNDDDATPPRKGNAWVLLALLLAAASVYLVVQSSPIGQRVAARVMPQPAAAASAAGPMDVPLTLAEIDQAIRDAVSLRTHSDEMGLTSASRACHGALRKSPSIARFDRCAAFDDAVVELQDRDPLRDQGPFSELAVTGRVRSGAALFSDDSLAIDSRLDRIRQRVELALARGSGH